MTGYRKTEITCTCTGRPFDLGHEDHCGEMSYDPCACCGAPARYHPHDPIGDGFAVCFVHVTATEDAVDERDVRCCRRCSCTQGVVDPKDPTACARCGLRRRGVIS